MTTSLLDIGNRIQRAYASSFAEGLQAFNEVVDPDGYLHVHIPAVSHKQDGEWITPDNKYTAQAEVMARIHLRVSVNAVRQIGDDLLVLETVYSATLPGGKDVSFDDIILWTFKNGRIVRQIQVASTEMWDTLRTGLQAASAPGYAAGSEYWKDEAQARRYRTNKPDDAT
jgi:ketosteroid isomerase-like protein